jgi:hypothetical protein
MLVVGNEAATTARGLGGVARYIEVASQLYSLVDFL